MDSSGQGECVPERQERLLKRGPAAQLEGENAYWTAVREARAAAGQVTIHSRETIAKGDMMKHRFGWHVVRVNRKSVTVALDWNDTTRPYKVEYIDVQGHHTPPMSRRHEPPPRR